MALLCCGDGGTHQGDVRGSLIFSSAQGDLNPHILPVPTVTQFSQYGSSPHGAVQLCINNSTLELGALISRPEGPSCYFSGSFCSTQNDAVYLLQPSEENKTVFITFFPTLLFVFSLAAEPKPEVSADPYVWVPLGFSSSECWVG